MTNETQPSISPSTHQVQTRSYTIFSAAEVADMEIPEVPYYLEGILRPKSKVCIVAREKMAKSMLAITLGLHLAEGRVSGRSAKSLS